jgi:hypothetical protein
MIPRVARTLFLQKNHPKSEQKREGCFSSTLGTLLDHFWFHLRDFWDHFLIKDRLFDPKAHREQTVGVT